MYLNSVTIVGFVGADPEQRQARNNGAKFTVLSVATQRSWKNAQDEWSSKTEWHRVCDLPAATRRICRTAIKKGSHVLVEGSLISSTYERPNGKGKKAADHEDHLVVHSRRRRPQARPRRARTGSCCFRLPRFGSSSRTNRRGFLLESQPTGPRRKPRPFFFAGRDSDQTEGIFPLTGPA